MPSGGGGSTTITPPPVDPNQQALEQQQTQLLQQQQQIISQQTQQENLLAPYLYQSIGLTPQYTNTPASPGTTTYTDPGSGTTYNYTNGQWTDPDGGAAPTGVIPSTINPNATAASSTITGFTPNATFQSTQDNATLQNQINNQLLQQEQQAINGTLPVNPAVSQSLNQSQQDLQSQLTAILGPDFAASTPGQKALASFAANKAAVTYGANTGQMTLDQQLALAGGQGVQQSQAGTLANTVGTAFGPSSATIGNLSSLASQYGQAQQPYQMQASNSLNAMIANSQASSAGNASQTNLFGSLIGAGGGLGAAAIFKGLL